MLNNYLKISVILGIFLMFIGTITSLLLGATLWGILFPIGASLVFIPVSRGLK